MDIEFIKERIKTTEQRIRFVNEINSEYIRRWRVINVLIKELEVEMEENHRKYQAEWDNKYREEMKRLRPLLRLDKIRLSRMTGLFHTENEWEDLKKEVDGICVRCRVKGLDLTKDHIVPIFYNGDDSIKNIQPLCFPCNLKKWLSETNYLEIYRKEKSGIDNEQNSGIISDT